MKCSLDEEPQNGEGMAGNRVGAAEDYGNIGVVLAIIEDRNGAIESFSQGFILKKNKGKVIDGNSSGPYFLSLLFFSLSCTAIYVTLLVQMMLLAMMVEAPQAVQS